VTDEDISLKRTRIEDRGIGPGGSDYLGWIYELEIAGRTYGLRSYDDEPGRIAFMDVRMAGESEPGPIRGGVPYADAVFARAARWLLATGEHSAITVLCSDPEHPNDAYVPVDPDRLVDRHGPADLRPARRAISSAQPRELPRSRRRRRPGRAGRPTAAS
jgi:hypothetical protein